MINKHVVGMVVCTCDRAITGITGTTLVYQFLRAYVGVIHCLCSRKSLKSPGLIHVWCTGFPNRYINTVCINIGIRSFPVCKERGCFVIINYCRMLS